MKNCCTCKRELDFSFFGKFKGSKDGFAHVCKECRHIDYLKNQETYKARASAWKKSNPEKRLENNRRWTQENLDKDRAVKNAWNKRNLEYCAFNQSKRKSKKLHATPMWADLDKIKNIYLNCPEGYHVDHIVPLQGKNVSGLHVESNLQYLPAIENLSKGNRYESSEC